MYKGDDISCDELSQDIESWENLKLKYQEELEQGNDVELNTFLIRNAQKTIEKLKILIDKKNNEKK